MHNSRSSTANHCISERDSSRVRWLQWMLVTCFLLVGTGGYFWYRSSAGTVVSSSAISDSTLTSGLVAHWTFDQDHVVWSDTTTEIKDSTAGAQHGNAVGSLSEASVVPGKRGQALKFNGTSDQIETPYNTTLTSYTFAFWFKTGDVHVDDYDTIIAKFYYDRCEIRGNSHTLLACTIDNSSNHVYSRSPVTDNAWHHGVFTVTSGSQKLYVDGAINDVRTDAFTSALDTISIGVDYDLSSAARFPGTLDDVRVYNRVLSASEVYQLYTAGTATVNAPVEDPLSQSLRGYWKLDTGSGTSAVDSSGNGNTLSMTGSPSWTTGNIGPYALDFSGSGQYLSVASPSSTLDFADGASFTITGWFNRDTFAADHTILSSKSAQTTSDGYIIWIDNNAGNDYLMFRADENGSTDAYTLTSSTNFSSTGWHHFAVSWNESAPNAVLYIDGNAEGSASGTAFASMGDLSNTNPFSIGAETDGGLPFDGKLDDIRIYGYALSADQVKKLYNTTAPTQPTDTSLVGHWTFDGQDMDSVNGVVYDRSANGNNGNFSISAVKPNIGKLGQAIHMNGTAWEAVFLSTATNLEMGTGDMTIASWINITSAINNVFIVTKSGSVSSEGYNMWYNSDLNTMEVSVGTGAASTSYGYDLPLSLIGSGWHSIACVIDRDAGVLFYLDGVFLGKNGSSVYNGTDITNTSEPAVLGHTDANADVVSYDDIRVYNRALSAAEIANVYNIGK